MKSYTYVLLNLGFMLVAWLLATRWLPRADNSQHRLALAVLLYFAMVIFNTYLTSLAIVRYDWQKVLGFKIVSWPIEDIAYLVVALYIAPLLWQKLQEHYAKPITSSTDPTSSPSSRVTPKAQSPKRKTRPRRSTPRRSRG
ncbi:MAG: lycopene cyclase domain-containing protein [Candidatus Saccharibacteria bacterium]